MNSTVEIIKLFSRDLNRELTIRKISKLIKKSYAHTNKEVWGLVKQGVLNHKEIGKSIICSINLKNDMARILLVFNSNLESIDMKDVSLIESLKQADAFFAFLSKGKLFVICEDKSKVKLGKAKILSKSEFLSSIKEIGLDNQILYGAEKYWETVGDMYE